MFLNVVKSVKNYIISTMGCIVKETYVSQQRNKHANGK